MKHITGKMKFECRVQQEEGILEQWGEPELGVHLSFNVFPQRYVEDTLRICFCLHLCFLKEMLMICLSPIVFPTRIIVHVCVSNRLSMCFLCVFMCFLKATLNMFVVAYVCKSVPKRNIENMIVFACIALDTICVLCIFRSLI